MRGDEAPEQDTTMKPFKYDSALQMHVQDPIEIEEINFDKLCFLRWTVENWHLRAFEHDGKPVSMPSGPFADYLYGKGEDQEVAAA